MKKINSLLDSFKNIDINIKEMNSTLVDLVKVTSPSNQKIMLDISSRLYQDEISRYRSIEDKASKFLALISFLLPSTTTILYWLYTQNSGLFNIYVILSIIMATTTIIVSLGFVLFTYAIEYKPVLEINDIDIDLSLDKNFDTMYLRYVKTYNQCTSEYRKVNKKKANYLDYGYRTLVGYYITSLLVLINLIISFSCLN